MIKSLNSRATGIITAFLIVFIPAFLMISFNYTSFNLSVMYFGVNIHVIVGFIYSIFKNLSKKELIFKVINI